MLHLGHCLMVRKTVPFGALVLVLFCKRALRLLVGSLCRKGIVLVPFYLKGKTYFNVAR